MATVKFGDARHLPTAPKYQQQPIAIGDRHARSSTDRPDPNTVAGRPAPFKRNRPDDHTVTANGRRDFGPNGGSEDPDSPE